MKTVVILGHPITVVDLPDLPSKYSNWNREDRDKFESLIHHAYDNKLNKISWNEVL